MKEEYVAVYDEEMIMMKVTTTNNTNIRMMN